MYCIVEKSDVKKLYRFAIKKSKLQGGPEVTLRFQNEARIKD